MRTITLISDWQNDGLYIGRFKAELYKKFRNFQLIEISHTLKNHNTFQAAYILKNLYMHFSAQTIHLICVDINVNHKILVTYYKNQYIITSDNGFLSLFLNRDETFDNIYELKFNKKNKNSLFPEIELYIPALNMILNKEAKGISWKKTSEYNKKIVMQATFDSEMILGHVMYIDGYGNVISNISQDLFFELYKSRKFSIIIKSNHYKINNISLNYNNVEPGDLFAIFNSFGYLEIGICYGKIADLLGIKYGEHIRVNFIQ